MIKYILFFLFINIYITAYNQFIKGTIFDTETKSTIPFATVYFNGTFVGTTSDQDGTFELDITKYASRPITISAVGYYSYTLTDYSVSKLQIIYLTPKIYEIKEVSISTKSLVRKRKANLKLFKQEFLGTTSYARKCEIINEKDITFNYGSDDDTLKAFALKPILINNNALGYNITYYLDKFEHDKRSKTTTILGSIIVNEDLAINVINKQTYEKRRKTAYLGSRMHFFRALWEDSIKSNGFTIYNSAEDTLGYEDIVFQKDSNEIFLIYSENLDIYYDYSDALYFKSEIIFLKEQVLFEQDGFFDPSGILWTGQMAEKRIADWLPYEYSISIE